uniref:Uncharacterized protein n=1 Tax=Opuntia streptacantha TaxID=393608 RepID=A0A7C9CFJ3_OPUST
MRRSNEAELKANFAAYQSEEVAVNGDYLRLNADSPPETSAPVIDDYGESNWWRIGYRRSKWFWLNVILFCAILSVIGVVVIKHYGPLFMDKVIFLISLSYDLCFTMCSFVRLLRNFVPHVDPLLDDCSSAKSKIWF